MTTFGRSLLILAFCVSLYSVAAALRGTGRRRGEAAPSAAGVGGARAPFCGGLLVYKGPPSTSTPTPPEGGAGLTPLRRPPRLLSPPPMLYSGYVGFSIPFA